MQAHYADLKHRADERGHEFKLTIEEYEEFWNSSGYAEKHGKTKEFLSIDRIRSEDGYVKGNIRALTVSQNSRLRHVPYFKTLAEEQSSVAAQDAYNSACQAIADALTKIFNPDSDEFRAEYTRRTNEIHRPI